MFQSNKTLIILILTCLFFVGALGLIYFTFGNKQTVNNIVFENLNSSVSSLTRTTKSFDDDTQSTQNSYIQSKEASVDTVLVDSPPSTYINSEKPNSTSSIDYTDITNKDLKLPESSKISYNFDAKDKETIGKYIKTDYENKINSILKDDKNNEIVAFKIPIDKIDSQTQKDFPRTFKFSNEDRNPLPKDKVFLYYTTEKRIAYLGEYINDIQAFENDSQNYWLVLYNGQILISKPNFSNWKIIDMQNDPVQGVYKKSNSEFQVLKLFNYENYEEYKIETINSQKYIIDGIFEAYGDD